MLTRDGFLPRLKPEGFQPEMLVDVITSTVKDLEESVSTYISENSIELDESLADSLTRHTANAIQSIQHATRRAKVSIKRTKAGTRIRRELGRRKSADRNRNTVTASIKPSARRKRARLAEQARQAEIRQRGMQQAAQSHIYHANQRRRMGYA